MHFVSDFLRESLEESLIPDLTLKTTIIKGQIVDIFKDSVDDPTITGFGFGVPGLAMESCAHSTTPKIKDREPVILGLRHGILIKGRYSGDDIAGCRPERLPEVEPGPHRIRLTADLCEISKIDPESHGFNVLVQKFEGGWLYYSMGRSLWDNAFQTRKTRTQP